MIERDGEPFEVAIRDHGGRRRARLFHRQGVGRPRFRVVNLGRVANGAQDRVGNVGIKGRPFLDRDAVALGDASNARGNLVERPSHRVAGSSHGLNLGLGPHNL